MFFVALLHTFSRTMLGPRRTPLAGVSNETQMDKMASDDRLRVSPTKKVAPCLQVSAMQRFR